MYWNYILSILPGYLGCNFQYTPALENKQNGLESEWIGKYAPSAIYIPRPSRLPQDGYFPIHSSSQQCFITIHLFTQDNIDQSCDCWWETIRSVCSGGLVMRRRNKLLATSLPIPTHIKKRRRKEVKKSKKSKILVMWRRAWAWQLPSQYQHLKN